jgi:hypothetical protein
MGRIAKLVEQQAVQRGPKCSVAQVLATYSKAERAEWDAAFADRSVTQAQILKAFRADGHTLGHNAIGRHARGDCNCG